MAEETSPSGWMAVADGRTAGGQLTRKISINQKAINWQHLVLLVVIVGHWMRRVYRRLTQKEILLLLLLQSAM